MEFINNPQTIEDLSMTIIEESLPEPLDLSLEKRQVIKRVVHATGDTSYADLLRIQPGAVAAGLTDLRAGCNIVTDVNMIKAGINRRRLETLGIKVSCYISNLGGRTGAARRFGPYYYCHTTCVSRAGW